MSTVAKCPHLWPIDAALGFAPACPTCRGDTVTEDVIADLRAVADAAREYVVAARRVDNLPESVDAFAEMLSKEHALRAAVSALSEGGTDGK